MTTDVAPLEVLTALADANRFALLDRLGRTGSASATTLAGEVTMSRQGVLKHLTVLEEARLVERRHVGREVVFTPSSEPLRRTAQWLETTTRAWDRRLADLKQRAEAGD